ncbi:hypothetical protein [Micromonospora sp. RP3T]|uniref:hypothetical protein n=1 Tax=Micromonospora sp. RP3T TaxID=2135446 RepID=UPI003D71D00B
MAGYDQRNQRVFGAQINADTVIAGVTTSPDELMGYGRRAIAEGLYPKAVEFFTEAIAKGAAGADPHYYLALALLGGRKPSRMGSGAQRTMDQVDEHLGRALQIEPTAAHVRALWIALKRDHYADRIDHGPSVAELQAGLGAVAPVHAAEITPFTESREDPLWQATLAVARAGIEARRPNVHRYFIRTPNPPLLGTAKTMMIIGGVLAGLGLVLLLIALKETALCCLAVPLGIGGAVMLVKGFQEYTSLTSAYQRDLAASQPKPTDEQMDLWLYFDKFGIRDHALRHLDTALDDLVCEPQLVIGPASPTQQARGQDGVLRFSRYKIVILLLGQSRISVFSCEWDFIRCIVSNTDAFDFRYRDITGLRMRQLHGVTEGSQLVIKGEDGRDVPVHFNKIFEMIIAGTDRIAVTIDVTEQGTGTGLQPTGATATERLIRRQLDEAGR